MEVSFVVCIRRFSPGLVPFQVYVQTVVILVKIDVNLKSQNEVGIIIKQTSQKDLRKLITQNIGKWVIISTDSASNWLRITYHTH